MCGVSHCMSMHHCYGLMVHERESQREHAIINLLWYLSMLSLWYLGMLSLWYLSMRSLWYLSMSHSVSTYHCYGA